MARGASGRAGSAPSCVWRWLRPRRGRTGGAQCGGGRRTSVFFFSGASVRAAAPRCCAAGPPAQRTARGQRRAACVHRTAEAAPSRARHEGRRRRPPPLAPLLLPPAKRGPLVQSSPLKSSPIPKDGIEQINTINRSCLSIGHGGWLGRRRRAARCAARTRGGGVRGASAVGREGGGRAGPAVRGAAAALWRGEWKEESVLVLVRVRPLLVPCVPPRPSPPCHHGAEGKYKCRSRGRKSICLGRQLSKK